ncbi:MAG: hypothetical protein IKL18_06230 [Oscillospiraceae bacterium]|nr:hypothetical protein [Oscillospiraceae bacterium]
MQENENYRWLSSANKNSGNGENSSEAETEPTAKEKAETSIEDLRNRYSEKIRENFDLAAKKLRAERDNALRENWILQQRAEAALPEQMAAGGINGGASESTLANLRAQYQGNRNDIRKGYDENLGEILKEAGEKQAENEDKYNRQWLEYLLSLAKMEEENEYKNGLR